MKIENVTTVCEKERSVRRTRRPNARVREAGASELERVVEAVSSAESPKVTLNSLTDKGPGTQA